MKYLLDTNICVALLRGSSNTATLRLNAEIAADINLCSIVKAELLYGAERSKQPDIAREQVLQFCKPYTSLPFDDRAAVFASKVRAHLALQGKPISPNDLLIAAIALAHDLTLVTANTREFSRVPDLRLENWEVA